MFHHLRALARLCVLAGIAASAEAQPTRWDTDHWVVTIPVAVEIVDDGRAEPQDSPFISTVVTTDVIVAVSADIPGVLPKSVPVFTTSSQGIRVQGVPMRANTSMQVYVGPPGPQAVYLDQGGNYQVYFSSFDVPTYTRLGGSDPPVITGDLARVIVDCANRTIPFQTVQIVYGSYPNNAGLYPRGNWQPTYMFDTSLPAGDTGTLIQAAADRTAARFNLLMAANIPPMRIQVTFQDMGDPFIGAGSAQFSVTQSYTQLRTNLIAAYARANEVGSEGPLYDLLPGGNSLAVKFRQNPTPVGVSNFVAGGGLFPQWLMAPPGPNEGSMTINSASFPAGLVNLDPRRGGIPGKADIDEIWFHETCHALGFSSRVDNSGQFMNKPFILDMFRLDAVYGPAVSQAVWQNVNIPRMLYPGTEAIFVAGLSAASLSFRLSTGTTYTNPASAGDGWTAGHWKYIGLLRMQNPTAEMIGIMDPVQTFAVNRPANLPRLRGYFTAADLRALTTIGWNLDVSAAFPGPASFPVLLPNPNTTISSLNPEIQWGESDGATVYHVTVYRVSPTGGLMEVFHAENVSASSLTIP